jgi:D-sedoheptulose 7-phosphate isomerase
LNFAKDYFKKLQENLEKIDPSQIEKIVDILLQTWKNGQQIFIVGNGGSAATASHFACDLGKGTIKRVHDCAEKRIVVSSLTDNVPLLTALANDVGYENVFAQQIYNQIKIGDILIVISGSGNSKNILKAIKIAQEKKAIVIGLLGSDGGKAKEIVDYCLIYNETHYERIEDAHSILAHLMKCWLKEKMLNLKGSGGFFKEEAK